MLLTLASAIYYMTVTYQQRYEAYVKDIAPKYEIRTELVEAIIDIESDWDETVESDGGAVGLMQIVPKWHIKRAEELLVDDFKEPYSNILIGCDYLAELIEKYGNETEALMVYNMGYKGAQLYESGTVSNYAKKVLNRAEELKEDNEDE